MWITEAASAAGVSAQTLRYYERRRLVRAVGRRESGYREYTPEDVQVVRFIKRAQELGFSLEESAELLSLRQARGGRAAVRALADRRLADMEVRIRDLTRMRNALRTLSRACHSGDDPQCPILEALDHTSKGGR